ncbi:ABC-2 transporter permease [Paenibacillus sp. 1001270B_150601_E10]|uniref:ABC-2 transporter permease n=1 Tax=Paenibacillus sp. 1001270B_150601_E10 TaxID=2787079 RepID=UPI00189DD67A|nr:ABC-2 transporter permease [Paenibacillus sp. 1001270B_150601_E10]
MKGLLFKDLFTIKMQSTFLLLVVFLGAFLTFSNGNSGFLIVILGIVLPVNAIAFDEKANWDKYALTMPISRRDLVTSKYVLSLIVLVLATILSAIFMFLIRKGDASTNFAALGGSLLAGMLLISLLLPLCFKLGTEKARLFLILIVFSVVGIGTFILSNDRGISFNLGESSLYTLVGSIAIAILLIFIFSMFLSIRIMEKKEIA